MNQTIIKTQDANCPHDHKTSCNNCRLSTICLPISLHLEDIDKLNSIIQRGKPLQRGEYLYRANQPFDAVFAIRSGAVKATTLSDNGEEQVTGFYLPGEVVGLDGLADNRYTNSVTALETASICEIPFHRLEELSLQIPNLQRHFFQLMSREITQDQQIISLLSKSSAEERIAALLLSISSRNSRRQLSAQAFRLPMSRTDIGNYLGLTIETVSRIFTRLQKQGIIAVDKKEVRILDMDKLREIANGENNA
ncbi:fumarate/nitrate reduction transcriptional regulator Fnr [Cellvibrio japonicus]|uniref:Transcriptional activator protein anr n=1 Tax=Cellvibrio japonicus (strain Ueda107) TaxID=498211 RepID=B3PJ84_CELJU|nr:fumarate/nitrate reduction transcriptional regulator Fnr [Cellvibrio japonicus]ACE83480.1 Transcriptional activator protein anr [Cellvibrio japonicus Ueda107]QEI14183.1 fumarate/nitrate reduction transcriptional regulator Fnr [Cellvibrio japonicus]QEI17760.1 fumarate/nitrate reduction transcriptional regulator Fnr [Cellvibrio japonicus]QEI21335.1 fumarate/nitrate reduction transcriptional regulator Fnr [Cellvibrio japonicus]